MDSPARPKQASDESYPKNSAPISESSYPTTISLPPPLRRLTRYSSNPAHLQKNHGNPRRVASWAASKRQCSERNHCSDTRSGQSAVKGRARKATFDELACAYAFAGAEASAMCEKSYGCEAEPGSKQLSFTTASFPKRSTEQWKVAELRSASFVSSLNGTIRSAVLGAYQAPTTSIVSI